MNKLAQTLLKLSWGRVVIAGIAMAVVYYFTLYNDGTVLNASLVDVQNQKALTEKKLKATQRAAAEADRFENELKDLTSQFKRITEFMPEKISSAELTELVSTLSLKTGARLMKTEPKPGTLKGEFFDSTQMSLTLEGSFSQIVMFLSQLSHIPRLFTFEKIELSNIAKSEFDMPVLSFSSSLVAYKYIKEDSGTPIDKKDPAAAPAASPAAAPAKAPNATSRQRKSGKKVAYGL